MSLLIDTILPFGENGANERRTLGYLTDIAKAVERPLVLLAYTKEGIIQEANGLDVGVKETTNVAYRITFENGYQQIATSSHRWRIARSVEKKAVVKSDITGFSFLETRFLQISDRIVANNQAGYLQITGLVPITTAFSEYYCLDVPMFGNFLISAPGTDGVETLIVSGSCGK
jgi:hypothetical protein